MPKNNQPERFDEVLPRLIGSIRGKKKYQEEMIFWKWDSIAGAEIARHIRPDRFSFKTLFLAADSPVWANQLLFFKTELISKINDFAGQPLVADIRFNASAEAFKRKNALNSKSEKTTKTVPVPTEAEEKKAAEFCAKITDEKLRRAAEKALSSELAETRLRLQQGWHQCRSCKKLCPPEEAVCFNCRNDERKTREKKIRELLQACPWSTYADINNYVSCTPLEANGQRAKLIQQLAGRLVYGDFESLDVKTLVMLADSVPYEQLDETRIKRVTKRLKWMMAQPDKKFKTDSYT